MITIQSKEPEPQEKAKHLSLLLVDDDAELCGMMREFLAQAGYQLECAYNGREGLACALNGAHDLIILDVMLPVLDGFGVLTQLRRRKAVPLQTEGIGWDVAHAAVYLASDESRWVTVSCCRSMAGFWRFGRGRGEGCGWARGYPTGKDVEHGRGTVNIA